MTKESPQPADSDAPGVWVRVRATRPTGTVNATVITKWGEVDVTIGKVMTIYWECTMRSMTRVDAMGDICPGVPRSRRSG